MLVRVVGDLGDVAVLQEDAALTVEVGEVAAHTERGGALRHGLPHDRVARCSRASMSAPSVSSVRWRPSSVMDPAGVHGEGAHALVAVALVEPTANSTLAVLARP